MSKFQIDFNGLMIGDEVSASEFGNFSAAPRVFIIKSLGGNKHDNRGKRWISSDTEPKVSEKNKLYESEGWRIEVLNR